MGLSELTRPWIEQDLPDFSGRVALLTGANSGTGVKAAQRRLWEHSERLTGVVYPI